MITDKVGGSSAKPEVSKQSKEKRLKHKVSGYKSQSKRRSIIGCRLLLRTLINWMVAIQWNSISSNYRNRKALCVLAYIVCFIFFLIVWDRSHLHRIHACYIVQPVAKIKMCTWNTVPYLGFDSLSPGTPPLMSKLL